MSIPLVEPLIEMPEYTKSIKYLATKKRTMDFERVEMSHSCSAIMSSNNVVKKEYPDVLTIPYTIGVYQFRKKLCDLGASKT